MIWSIIHSRVGWVTRWTWVLRIRGLFRSLCKDKRMCSGVTLSPWLLTLTKKDWKTWGGLDCVFTCLRVKVCNGLVPEARSRAVQCGNFEPSVWCQKVVADPVKQAWESLYDSLSINSPMPLSYFAAYPSSVPKHTHFNLVTLGLQSPSTVLLIF